MTKEERKAYNRQYYLQHKEKFIETNTRNYQSYILPYWIVYILPLSNYAGICNNPVWRIYDHKYKGRDTTGWYEVARYNTRKKALVHEALLHSQGYFGAKGTN